MIDKSGLKLNDAVVQSSGQQLTQIDQVLSQPNLVTVTEDFDKHRGEKKYDPAWYVPLGQRNFRSIAKEVDKLSQYELLYSGASEVMHSSSYDHHVRIGHHELTFEPVRSLEGFENVFRFSVAVAFSTFRRILEEYRPGELSAFSRKYMEKWRREFMNFPRITYQVNFTRI